MEEEELKNSIELYKTQLSQVNQAIQAAGATPDLEALQGDLTQLIQLTEESLLSLKKGQLLKLLDTDVVDTSFTNGNRSKPAEHHTDTTRTNNASTSNNVIDDEYAAFQEMLGTDVCANTTTSQATKVAQSPSPEYGTDPGGSCSNLVNLPREDAATSSSLLDSEKGRPVDLISTVRAETSNSSSINTDIARATSSSLLDPEKGRPVDLISSTVNTDIVGTKCRTSYTHEWGERTTGNALIADVEAQSDPDLPKVKVMFCNPTHLSMLPCKYYLSGSCKFEEQGCRYSHGYVVNLEDLQEYIEPDYSTLQLESRCLARYDKDDLWYKATVVDLGDNSMISVMFDGYDDEAVELAVEDVLPTVEGEESKNSSDEEDDIRDRQPIRREDSDDEDEALPVFLWKPPTHGLGDLGQWEAHTKGIGSKLLSKMGYRPGEGLGRHSDGRIQPVPIQLLPQGKSLDKIMELKAISGDRNLYDVMKQQEKSSKKHAKKLENQYNKATQADKHDVFSFINKRLGKKKGKLSDLIHHHEGQGHTEGQQGQGQSKMHRNISEQDLQSKSDRNINIQLLKTGQEIKGVEKELGKLRESLARNADKGKNVVSRIREKITSLESYVGKLRSSENTMVSHQQKRSDHKKLTVF